MYVCMYVCMHPIISLTLKNAPSKKSSNQKKKSQYTPRVEAKAEKEKEGESLGIHVGTMQSKNI